MTASSDIGQARYQTEDRDEERGAYQSDLEGRHFPVFSSICVYSTRIECASSDTRPWFF